MTISESSCPSPAETNPLYNNGFVFTLTAVPELSFFCKEFVSPNVSLSPMEQATPFIKIPHPGTHLEYGQFTVTCNCDEKMKNYKALYTWLKEIGFKDDHQQIINWRRRQGDPQAYTNDSEVKVTCDATLVIRGPNQSSVAAINFKSVWPTDLSGLTFTEETSESTVVSFQVTFQFTSFDFVDV